MKLLSLIAVVGIGVGIAQLCSSESITIFLPTSETPVAATTEEIHEISDERLAKIKLIQGVNMEWVIEWYRNLNQVNPKLQFSLGIQRLAQLYSTSFGVDFAAMNQTLFERMRDTTGCGEHFPENRTLDECRRIVYPEKIKNKSADEVKSMLDKNSIKFQNALSPYVDASKLKQIEFMLQGSVLDRRATSLEDQQTLFNIMVSTFHDRANISKRDACVFWAKMYQIEFDCTTYTNENDKTDSDQTKAQ